MNCYHFFRQATLKATGEVVRLDFYASLTNTFTIVLRGDSHPTFEVHATELTDFSR